MVDSVVEAAEDVVEAALEVNNYKTLKTKCKINNSSIFQAEEEVAVLVEGEEAADEVDSKHLLTPRLNLYSVPINFIFTYTHRVHSYCCISWDQILELQAVLWCRTNEVWLY